MRDETIEHMRRRHEGEITRLQDFCKHKKVSQCMPFEWVPAHVSHCVKICEFCGKELETTAVKSILDNRFKGTGIKPDNYFECPRRKDCLCISTIPYGTEAGPSDNKEV